jgi:hypothetical protein
MKNYTFDILDAEDGSGDAVLQFSEEFLKDEDWRVNDRISFKVEGNSLIMQNLDWMEREGLSK